MNKRTVINNLAKFGDSIVDMSNGDSFAVTIDFSTPYIKRIRRPKERFNLKDKVLVFNWTTNKFDALPAKDIKNLTPLSNVLNNKVGSVNG